ncbi:unnamed protein product [Miscanthus lutarioriparius]|uniref:TF-B3 domain-containing protein n=1 Tax=Miscanthus lutarioriparius TaxID=422564 RepID=A0A811R2N7_9POAL|nr:unnamed protein product [Miscanthus lutarioriparius]
MARRSLQLMVSGLPALGSDLGRRSLCLRRRPKLLAAQAAEKVFVAPDALLALKSITGLRAPGVKGTNRLDAQTVLQSMLMVLLGPCCGVHRTRTARGPPAGVTEPPPTSSRFEEAVKPKSVAPSSGVGHKTPEGLLPVARSPHGRLTPNGESAAGSSGVAAQGHVGRAAIMPRLAVEPLPLHRGRTFVKHFDAPFKTSIAIPTEVWNIIKEDNSSTIMLTGDSMGYHEITVELQNNKHVFTNGWTAFVEVERIPRGDMAVFAWVREGTLSMCLYGPNGGDKPMANRPPHGHPLLEDFHQQPTDDPENGGDVYVPANILGMVFELGAGVVMGPEIMQTLANVWHYWDSSFALYVCIIVPTQVGPRSHFWFGSNFSQTLEYRKRVVMFSSTATMSVVREFW